jgi:hypothetical protein
MAKTIIAVCFALVLAACAVPYREGGGVIFGLGYTQKQLSGDIWRVSFKGNGLTSRETVQTYWLYRSAELTVQKGYDGFEIVTRNPFLAHAPDAPGGIQVAAAGPIFIPMYEGPGNYPQIEADIRLLHRPFEPAPPKVFDAPMLHAALEPYVKGEKCDGGNVCPHVHTYLFKDGKVGSTTE